jgi:hypothetical protein
MSDADIIKKNILRRLMRSNIWGGKHTPLDFVKKGVAEEYTKKENKAIEKVVKELVNRGWLLMAQKRTGRDSSVHVSLNPKAAAEIFAFLDLPPRE